MGRHTTSAFTLIEMLIVLSIFTVLIGLLLTGFRQGLQAWERNSKQQSALQKLLLRHNALEQMVMQSVEADYVKTGAFYLPYFQGNSQEASWMTAAALLDVPGQIHPVALKFQKTDAGLGLYYREGEWHSDPGRDIRWSTPWTLLIAPIIAGDFSYEALANPVPADMDERTLTPLEKLRYRDNAEWLSEFDSSLLWLMPSRIKVHFVETNQQEHTWFFSLPDSANVGNLGNYFESESQN